MPLWMLLYELCRAAVLRAPEGLVAVLEVAAVRAGLIQERG